jgi:hypothetical protein
MKQGPRVWGRGIMLATLLAAGMGQAAPVTRTNLFFTGFEYLEGFDTGLVLAVQNGWRDFAELNGNPVPDLLSNGLVTNVFAGLGQQGWIGGTFVDEPVGTGSTLSGCQSVTLSTGSSMNRWTTSRSGIR